MSETDLATRQGLPQPYRYLVEAFPRLRWHEPQVGAMARFWLQMHSGFRRETAAMTGLTSQWRSGALALPELHRQLMPTLQGFLQHLDGHHNIETHHYFPTMRRLEPRIGSGVDLLDADHDAIHAHLDALYQSGLAFHQAVAGNAPTAGDAAARLADVLDRAQRPLLRHLEDEEDIVIPLITRHADVFRE
ncbi:MAG: hemerythrin domain-containing protein [Pseudomonadota bacterium]